jgi:SAM-dependent methyltransferase
MGEAKKDEIVDAQARKAQLSLPFDQYQRYRVVADVLELLRDGAEPLRILDVGGGEGIILNFLPADEVTVLDQLDVGEGTNLIQGDATALPFEDGAFDYVVSVDVYEHIEPDARDTYLSELRRTARSGVLLAAPFDSEEVRGAEQLANDFHRAVHLAENVWLKEHAENGLPRLEDTRDFFEERGDALSVLPNGYIPHWLAMICLTFYSSKLDDESGGVFERVNAFYNEFMYRLDNAEPCYRHLLVSLREPASADLAEVASHAPAPERASLSSALVGTLSATLPLAAEVKQLNAEVRQVSNRLADRERRLNQREKALDQRQAKSDAQIAEYENRLAEKEGAVARREAQVNDLTRRLAERVGTMNSSWVQAERRVTALQQDRNRLQQDIARITESRAWRLLTVLHNVRLRFGNMFRSG